MKLRLYDYQQEIYDSIVKQLEGIAEYAEDDKKRKDMAAILMATGTGKSFITLKLLEDNPDKNILFVCPNNFIRTQMYGYILKYLVDENVLKEKVGHNDIQKMSANEIEKIANECYPGFKIRSYQIMNSINCKFGISSRLNNLFRKENNEEEEDINPDQDYIIFDELHRIGAENWGKEVQKFMAYNAVNNEEQNKPVPKILGMTATSKRMDGYDVVVGIFGDFCNEPLALRKASEKGIINLPKYCAFAPDLIDKLSDLSDKEEDASNKLTKEKDKEIHNRSATEFKNAKEKVMDTYYNTKDENVKKLLNEKRNLRNDKRVKEKEVEELEEQNKKLKKQNNQEQIQNNQEQIQKNKEQIKKKKEIIKEKTEMLEKIRNEEISEFLSKSITKKDGRYIIFCKNKEEIEKFQNIEKEGNVLKKWFSDNGFGEKPSIYAIHSGNADKENEERLQAFQKDNSDNIKLLLSVKMCDEGIHLDNIDGIILNTSTKSDIQYSQRIGRVISTDNEQERIVIDLASNWFEICEKTDLPYEINFKENMTYKVKNDNENSNDKNNIIELDKIISNKKKEEENNNIKRNKAVTIDLDCQRGQLKCVAMLIQKALQEKDKEKINTILEYAQEAMPLCYTSSNVRIIKEQFDVLEIRNQIKNCIKGKEQSDEVKDWNKLENFSSTILRELKELELKDYMENEKKTEKEKNEDQNDQEDNNNASKKSKQKLEKIDAEKIDELIKDEVNSSKLAYLREYARRLKEIETKWNHRARKNEGRNK